MCAPYCMHASSRARMRAYIYLHVVYISALFPFFAEHAGKCLQTLHDRKFPKQKAGDLEYIIIFFFDLKKFTWAIYILKEVICPSLRLFLTATPKAAF
jgi:hypothetical protein